MNVKWSELTNELKNYVRIELFNAHVEDSKMIKNIVLGMIAMIVIAFFGAVIHFFITTPVIPGK